MAARSQPSRPESSPEAEAEADGRRERSARSRQRIIESLVELVEAGELVPTGQQVADRAKVGLRTVFRHFEDMENLHAEIRAHLEKVLRPSMPAPLLEGDLETRVASLIRRRATAFERVTPFQRSEAIRRWRSPVLRESHAEMVRELRTDLQQELPELRQADDSLRQGIELLTSFEAWERLRTDQGLSRNRAEESLRVCVMSILESNPS